MCHCRHVIARSQDVGQQVTSSEKDSSLLQSANQGPQMLEITLFDWPCLLTTPSTALISITHAQA